MATVQQTVQTFTFQWSVGLTERRAVRQADLALVIDKRRAVEATKSALAEQQAELQAAEATIVEALRAGVPVEGSPLDAALAESRVRFSFAWKDEALKLHAAQAGVDLTDKKAVKALEATITAAEHARVAALPPKGDTLTIAGAEGAIVHTR